MLCFSQPKFRCLFQIATLISVFISSGSSLCARRQTVCCINVTYWMFSSKLELTSRPTSGAPELLTRARRKHITTSSSQHTHPKPVIRFQLKHFSSTCTPLEVKLHNSRQTMEIFELMKICLCFYIPPPYVCVGNVSWLICWEMRAVQVGCFYWTT